MRIERILVPLDFSESSVDALRFALPFARETGAQLDLLHVIEPVPAAFGAPGEAGYLPPSPDKQQQRAAAARLKQLVGAEIRRPVNARTLVKEGAPARAINEAAVELRSDLLILSTHGHTGLKRFFHRQHRWSGGASRALSRAGRALTRIDPYETEEAHCASVADRKTVVAAAAIPRAG